jgi:hypothetical protein
MHNLDQVALCIQDCFEVLVAARAFINYIFILTTFYTCRIPDVVIQ